MGKEERDKRREEKEREEAEQQEKKRKDQINALSSIFKILRDNKLNEEKIVIGNARFSLFQGNQYCSICESHYTEIATHLDNSFGEKLKQEKDEKRTIALTNCLLKKQAIFKVEPNPETIKIRNNHNSYIPTQVQEVTTSQEISDAFFVFNPRINIQPKNSYFYMILILLGIALVILFPVWPLALKRGLFYISVVILFLLIGMIVVRTFLYFLVRVFGYDFYLFPNLFAEDSFFNSFTPIIGYQKCDDSTLFVIIRTIGIFALIGGVYFLSLEGNSITQFGKQSFGDLLQWGYSKLESNKEPPPKSIEQIMEDFDRQYEEGGLPENILEQQEDF